MEQYRLEHDLSYPALALQLDSWTETVRCWCNGSREPKKGDRDKIRKGTKGTVEFVAGFERKK